MAGGEPPAPRDFSELPGTGVPLEEPVSCGELGSVGDLMEPPDIRITHDSRLRLQSLCALYLLSRDGRLG